MTLKAIGKSRPYNSPSPRMKKLHMLFPFPCTGIEEGELLDPMLRDTEYSIRKTIGLWLKQLRCRIKKTRICGGKFIGYLLIPLRKRLEIRR